MQNYTYGITVRSLKTALLLAGLLPALAHAEGSKDITPGTGNRGTATGVNNYIGYLQRHDGANSGNFLKLNATAASPECFYVHLEPGEKLYHGVRRTNAGNPKSRLRLEVKYGAGIGTLGPQPFWSQPLAPMPTALPWRRPGA